MESLIKEYITKIPLFSGVNHKELLHVLKDCDVKVLKPGQYIYKYGDYGEDCGFVLSGLVSVELNKKIASDHSKIKILLKEGDIFGEIASLSGYIRTADVVALEPTRILIVSKKTLFQLFDKFRSFKNKIDKLYRERVLGAQLPSTPIFMGLPENLIEKLIERATLHSYNKGDIVFHQGDKADAFYLVRYGFVKITETGDDGRRKVLAYLKGGSYFGEMALMKEQGKRMATVTAIDRTELIRISRKDFHLIIDLYPRIKSSLEKGIAKTEKKNIRTRGNDQIEKTLTSAIDSGFIQAKEILVIDFTKCIHCDRCVKACSVLHNNQTRLVKKGVKLNNVLLVATSCRHCEDPTCMIKCPTGAIARSFSGEIYHKDSCIGCGQCATNCPYGHITIVTSTETDKKKNITKEFFSKYRKKRNNRQRETDQTTDKKQRLRKKAVKCDMCLEYPLMACVYNCPTGAARRIDPNKFFGDILGVD
jgi:CRP-like cAMP-binding protein